MPQLHLYVDDALSEALHREAAAAGASLSRYLATLVQRELHRGWPDGWFEAVVGGWQGPLDRADQGEYESRQAL